MTVLTTSILPYQIEGIYVPPDEHVFKRDMTEPTAFGMQSNTLGTSSFVDDYFDTEHADLHAGAVVVRTRTGRGASFPLSLQYKGPPRYMHQTLTARSYAYAQITSRAQLDSFLALQVPCEPMQFLYRARPDLVGKSLSVRAHSANAVTVRNLADSATPLELNLAYYDYVLKVGPNVYARSAIVELQLTARAADNLPRYLHQLRKVESALTSAGYRPSPVTKYQRIPREAIEN